MRRKDTLPELLAPAGSYEALLAAVEAGADAVYLGGKNFGARAYATNFDNETLQKAITYAHIHGVKVYVTVNTLLYDRELSDALAFCRELYAMGADALIVADLGLVRLLREHLPGMELHASTQMGVHNAQGADEAWRLGCTRVVLARECSLADMSAVIEKCAPECEVFLHGALCVCHSGQCLFSSMVGGRSGNRGECAQPCRLPYNGKNSYPLSLRDLSLARHIKELIAAGVASLKIEGRMKSPTYVYEVTKIYRTLLDEGRDSQKREDARLDAVFSRGGFTDGYFTGRISAPMTGVRSEEQKEKTRTIEERPFLPKALPIRAEAVLRADAPARLRVSAGETSVQVSGEIPAPAQNAPLTKAGVSARLCKTGGTFFSLAPEDLSVELTDGLNLSPGQINALRRDALAALEKELTGAPADLPETVGTLVRPASLPRERRDTALFYDPAVLGELIGERGLLPELCFVLLWRYAEAPAGTRGVLFPPVLSEGEYADALRMANDAKAAGATHALVGNLSHIALARDCGLIPVGDFRLNVHNAFTAAAYLALGVEDYILSPELTLPQMRAMGGRPIVYGRIPLMITERCFVRENGGCDRCGRFALTDRMGASFPILREYPHRNVIFNSLPTYMGDRREAMRAAGLIGGHFIFSTESAGQIRTVLKAYRDGEPLPFAVRRIKA